MAQAVATVDLTPQSCSVPKPRNFRAQASLRSCRPACEKEGKPLVHSRQNSNRMDSGEVSEAGMQADDSRQDSFREFSFMYVYTCKAHAACSRPLA